ncbi:H-NS family nucleoid-associated regulatory protein, partial [Klebsiella variicola]|uniref:H-NS family nucleoid-associated regulatory protein n=1 Tax=Klebsiella variicola TaxID=244366 RepID=UPI002731D861
AKYRNQATGETWSGRGLQQKLLLAAIAGGAMLGVFGVYARHSVLRRPVAGGARKQGFPPDGPFIFIKGTSKNPGPVAFVTLSSTVCPGFLLGGKSRLGHEIPAMPRRTDS